MSTTRIPEFIATSIRNDRTQPGRALVKADIVTVEYKILYAPVVASPMSLSERLMCTARQRCKGPMAHHTSLHHPAATYERRVRRGQRYCHPNASLLDLCKGLLDSLLGVPYPSMSRLCCSMAMAPASCIIPFPNNVPPSKSRCSVRNVIAN